jgi:hypothetical protein
VEYLSHIGNKSNATYKYFQFTGREKKISVTAASRTDGGLIEVVLGETQMRLAGTITIKNTGGWQAWQTFEAPVTTEAGVRALCLYFKGEKAGRLFNLLDI